MTAPEAAPADRRDAWDDPRVQAGMERVLELRERLLGEGARPIGWKVAFGTPAATEALGLTGPVVGFLTDKTLIAPGGECAVAGWTAPKLEPEIGIWLGPGGEGVAGITTAIELADADRPMTDLEPVLAADIYHRGIVLDPSATPQPLRSPIAARISRDGEEIAATDDAEAAVGKLDELAAYVVRYLSEFSVATAEGEVIISGSVVGLLDIAPGQRLRHELTGIGALEVSIV
jgi:2-keto-4-pentenoate hydratase